MFPILDLSLIARGLNLSISYTCLFGLCTHPYIMETVGVGKGFWVDSLYAAYMVASVQYFNELFYKENIDLHYVESNINSIHLFASSSDDDSTTSSSDRKESFSDSSTESYSSCSTTSGYWTKIHPEKNP